MIQLEVTSASMAYTTNRQPHRSRRFGDFTEGAMQSRCQSFARIDVLDSGRPVLHETGTKKFTSGNIYRLTPVIVSRFAAGAVQAGSPFFFKTASRFQPVARIDEWPRLWIRIRRRPLRLLYSPKMETLARLAARVAAAAVLLTATAVFAQAPRIDSVSPSEAPIAGGMPITLRGANLAGTRFSIDDQEATATSVSAGELRFTAPKHDNGYSILRVTSAAGTATARLLYMPPALKELAAGYITTVAGVGRYWGDYGPAREASVEAGKLAYGPDGALYLPQAAQNRAIRIRPDGILEPFFGMGRQPPSRQLVGNGGPALEAAIGFPRGIAMDNNGDVYLGDTGNSVIWRFEAATGTARLIAGTGAAGYGGDDGPASLAVLNSPCQLAGDGRGTIWFIDANNSRIRRITPDGRIDTIAGTGVSGFSGDDGPAVSAQIFIANGSDDGALAYDPDGFLYLSDQGNSRIRRIDLNTGVIQTFIGPNRNFGANLSQLRTVIVAPGGDVYFSVYGQIFHVTRDGELRERFGVSDGKPPTFDGTPVADARVGSPWGLAVDPQGNLVWSDNVSGRVLRMNRVKGVVETVAGIGPAAYGEDGPALGASPVEHPNAFPDLAVTPAGELLFTGMRLRKLGLDGRLSVVAGAGANFGNVAEGPALETRWQSLGLDFDAQGAMYFATYENVVQVAPGGTLRRFAGTNRGNFGCGLSGDGGPALNAELCQPHDVALDRDGNAYIADTNNNRVRRVDGRTGVIATFAGSGPVNGFERFYRGTTCGDGGPATEACINTPESVAVNSLGEVFIAEAGRIRKVDRSGTISTYYRGSVGYTAHMRFDSLDNLFVPVGYGIVRISPGGTANLVVGQGATGFGGDGGPAAFAALCDTGGGGVGFDAEGNLYFIDGANRRIRAVRYGAVFPPQQTSARIAGGTPQTASIGALYAAPLVVEMRHSAGEPISNIRVDFIAPPQGPSCVFSNGQTSIGILTDRDGRAEAVCVANTTAGAFTVAAKPLGPGPPMTFSLANQAPKLASNSIVNGASFAGGPVAPGEIVTIFGSGLGPQQLAVAAPGSNGGFGTQLGGVRARFNGIDAPLLFARFDQVGAIAPYALDGAALAQVTVEFAGVASNVITVPVAPASPAIFSADSSGRGQGAILNQDGSPNSAANPADRSSIVVLFCTGEGQTDPPGVDGRLANGVYPKPKLPVTATIGGVPAEILYAGAAPTLVAGVLQINVRVPGGIPPGPAPVNVTIGNLGTPSGVTVAIR